MKELMFEDHRLEVIERDGQAWLKASDIATALGYSRTDKIARLYAMHAAEFSKSMTILVENPVSGFSGITTQNRLFNLRGAHLLGMFARTKKGVEFRRWVLDRLDEIERQTIPQRSLMHAWFEIAAKLNEQERFASLCGKGLSDHKKLKPPLVDRLLSISEQLQPSLFQLPA